MGSFQWGTEVKKIDEWLCNELTAIMQYMVHSQMGTRVYTKPN